MWKGAWGLEPPLEVLWGTHLPHFQKKHDAVRNETPTKSGKRIHHKGMVPLLEVFLLGTLNREDQFSKKLSRFKKLLITVGIYFEELRDLANNIRQIFWLSTVSWCNEDSIISKRHWDIHNWHWTNLFVFLLWPFCVAFLLFGIPDRIFKHTKHHMKVYVSW